MPLSLYVYVLFHFKHQPYTLDLLVKTSTIYAPLVSIKPFPYYFLQVFFIPLKAELVSCDFPPPPFPSPIRLIPTRILSRFERNSSKRPSHYHHAQCIQLSQKILASNTEKKKSNGCRKVKYQRKKWFISLPPSQ